MLIYRYHNPTQFKGIKRLLVILLLCAGLSACTGDDPPVRVDLSRRESVEVKDVDNAVTYAYLPQYSHSVSFQRHHLLVEYLKKETGYPIRQVFPDTFDEHMRMAGQGKVDISFTNPYVYVKTAYRYGERAFAQVIEDSGQKSFRGQII